METDAIEKHQFLRALVSLFIMVDNAHQSEDKVIEISSHMTGEDQFEKWLLKVIKQEGVTSKLASCIPMQWDGMKIDIGTRSNSETHSEDGCLNAWIDGVRADGVDGLQRLSMYGPKSEEKIDWPH